MQHSEQTQQEALKRRDLSELTNMINNGTDVNSMVVPKHTDILLASINKEHRSLFKTILAKGFKCRNQNGFLYIHHAIRTHNIFFVEALIEHYKDENNDFNERNSDGDNGLHIAAGEIEAPSEIFKYLSDIGISWIEKNNYGETPLHVLLNTRLIIDEAIVSLLENNMSAFVIADKVGITPLKLINDAAKNKEWVESNKSLLKLAAKVK